MAIRLARAVTGRNKIIKFQGCYHGWHDYVAMNVISPEGKVGKKDPISAGSLKEAVDHTIICAFNNLDDVEEKLRENNDQVAAIIVEPIPHNIGCVMPQPGFLEGLREITRMKDIILIFDEVITGFRHGLGGYQAICGVTPDLTTMGKAMANGYPIAAIGGRADLMDRFSTNRGGDVYFAGTYNGHPLACAAAVATIEVLETPGSYEHLFSLGERMRHGLAEIMERRKIRSLVAGFGSVFLTYFMEGQVRDYTDLLRNDARFFVEYRQRLLDKGVFKLPMNLKRNHISLSHTVPDIDRTLQACEDSIKEMQ
jgi:glutamate-1-semialdehyde 2,1-aminomutase